jgi:hypothetical protein
MSISSPLPSVERDDKSHATGPPEGLFAIGRGRSAICDGMTQRRRLREKPSPFAKPLEGTFEAPPGDDVIEGGHDPRTARIVFGGITFISREGRLPDGQTVKRPGLHPSLLLAVALLFNAVLLAPELRISRVPLNDLVFHFAASERLAESFERREPFLDPWVSEWSLGYPLWRSYQPLPHVIGAVWLKIAEPFVSHPAAFAALHYFLLVLLPASVFGGARLLGMSSLAAGLASLLALAPSGVGDLDRYGLSYGATTWRGSGLYTQVVALHFFLWALGLAVRALDTGRGRAVAALFLAATALSHIVFGYVAFVSAALLALVGPAGERMKRCVRLATITVPALVLLLWFVVPLLLSRAAVNHSRWEDAFKWDSFGARFIVGEILSGRFFDGGRLPILSVLVAVGAVAGALSIREALPRRFLALAGLWLVLYFGRETWGHLLLLVGVPADLHLHRLQAAFELSAVLLAAWGIERTVRAAAEMGRPLGVVAVISVASALAPVGLDRARYLQTNATWGRKNLAAFERERADLEAAMVDVRAILDEWPGRVSAGKAGSWGNGFKIGDVPLYAFLTREHSDQVSFLYHSMSLGSDIMVLRDENNPLHDKLFGVRAVVAPAGPPMPTHLRLRGVHGRFAVYQSSFQGYFDLVDIGARYTGPPSTRYEPSSAWLTSNLLPPGIVAAFDSDIPGVSTFGRWDPFPPASRSMLPPRGRIVSETKLGETYRALVSASRPCYALVKLSWHPDLVASVDGKLAPVLHVTPEFAAVAVTAGEHEVIVRYEPGHLKPLLFVLGALLFAVFARASRRGSVASLEEWAVVRLSPIGARLDTPRIRTALALAALIVVATRPLFRGRLVDGHDALEYPPRLVEMDRVFRDGHFPPIWAPDLGNGHGQPLFEFAPPLVYVAALPFRAAGLRLADALQLGLALLVAAGGTAIYRIGRRIGAGRVAALGGAGAWLFAPYLALDLYVRAAFAEAAALAVAPIALLGLLRAIDRPTGARIAAASFAVALVPLAHNGAALLLLPALAVVAVARALSAERPWPCVLAAVSSLAVGLGLSAFFWLPALLEKDFVKTELLREGFLHWSEHSIDVLQLLWSRWGYGLSVPGPSDQMSFALGLPHLTLAAAGFWLVLRSREHTRRVEATTFVALVLLGAWLATTWSAPVWSRITALQYLAYPWRTLLLPGLFLPLLAVGAFERLGRRAGLVALALVALVNLPHTEPKGYLTFDDEYYAPQSIAEKGINTTTREEYEPRWVESRPPFTKAVLASRGAPITVREISIATARQELEVTASAPTEVEARTFYYPGWKVAVDGSEVAIAPVAERGTISFSIPPGEHHVALDLGATATRRIGRALTLVTLGVLVAASIVLDRLRCRI